MSTVPPPLMTTEELLALPDDGVDRWLIRGELRESPTIGRDLEKPTTVRNHDHSFITIKVGKFLDNWLDDQPEPRGEVVGGEAGARLHRTPESTVGIDVAYFAAATIAPRPADTTLIDGAPILAVEILSPSDVQENIDEKVDEYLAAGVRLVWLIDPHDRTVTIYRPGQPVIAVNQTQELTGDPDLPGFRVAVARLFR